MLNDEDGSSHMHTTAWSMVLGAQQAGPAGTACLDRLIRTYWKPAYYYARRRGMDHHAASDCVQEFFARMLGGDWLQSVDRERGSFRGWLLTALRRWVGRARQPTGMERITLVNDEVVQAYEREDASANPEELFHKAWAASCLDEALRLMTSEAAGSARAKQVAVFTTFLEETTRNGQPPSYEVMAERFQTTVTAVTNLLHRGRSLFKTYLLRALRDTVEKPEDAERELGELRRYLGA